MEQQTLPVLSCDQEFASLCLKLTEDEESHLLESLKEEGCRDPVCYWDSPGNPILDGYHRKRLCEEHGIEYPTRALQFADRQAAVCWILRNQLGRRNATEVQKHLLRARLYTEYAARKPDFAGPRPNIAAAVAEETGVSKRQIHRDVGLAKQLKQLADRSPALHDAAVQQLIPKSVLPELVVAPDPILRTLEAAEPSELAAATKAVLQRAAETKREAAAVDMSAALTALKKLEHAVGLVVRANTDALHVCGGKAHHEAIRHHDNAIFDEIAAWKRDVDGGGQAPESGE